jgi:hypothetical protein
MYDNSMGASLMFFGFISLAIGLLGYYVDPKQKIDTEISHQMDKYSAEFDDGVITRIIDYIKDPMGKILIGILMIVLGYWTHKHPDNISNHFRPY